MSLVWASFWAERSFQRRLKQDKLWVWNLDLADACFGDACRLLLEALILRVLWAGRLQDDYDFPLSEMKRVGPCYCKKLLRGIKSFVPAWKLTFSRPPV